jgi:hypothetical protein
VANDGRRRSLRLQTRSTSFADHAANKSLATRLARRAAALSRASGIAPTSVSVRFGRLLVGFLGVRNPPVWLVLRHRQPLVHHRGEGLVFLRWARHILSMMPLTLIMGGLDRLVDGAKARMKEEGKA